MSAQRIHPEDLRALVAAALHSGQPHWTEDTRGRSVRETDKLLAELARTEPPGFALGDAGAVHEIPKPGSLAWEQAEKRFRNALGVGQRIDFDVLKIYWKAEGAMEERERIAQRIEADPVYVLCNCNGVDIVGPELRAFLEAKP